MGSEEWECGSPERPGILDFLPFEDGDLSDQTADLSANVRYSAMSTTVVTAMTIERPVPTLTKSLVWYPPGAMTIRLH